MRIENVTLVDGQCYHPGDEIWDLGSFVATSAKGKKRNYEGLSKDVEKLPHYVDTGSSAFCLDTGDYYKYLRSTGIWYKIGNNQASCGCCLGTAKIMNESIGTPVGEVISYMGNTVPENYLACDGSEYNISEYQELADHFMKEFGSVNYFGGNGETTFAVPDLRGEFLRGTGTNSHANSGMGASVGNHQDATRIPSVLQHYGTKSYIYTPGDDNYRSIINQDSFIGQNTDGFNYVYTTHVENGDIRNPYFTARPTNTSVLYCIKCKPTYYMTIDSNDGNLNNKITALTNKVETLEQQIQQLSN